MRQPAVSHVVLKHATYGEYQGVKPELLITPRCLSFAELEEFIDHLKQELGEIKKEAKGKYEEYKHLQQSW